MRTFCLSVHARYACRHSGACCTASWPIQMDFGMARELRRRMNTPNFLDHVDGLSYLTRRPDGSCVFLEREGGLCAIHRIAGPDLLPLACRHFPRVALTDPRGTFVTLSGFCPTVASMLLDHGRLHVVEAPAPLALNGTLEGLDATAVLPPLLRPGILIDYESYAAWERAAIGVLDRDDLDARQALDIIEFATRAVQRWTEDDGPMVKCVDRAFSHLPPRAANPRSLDTRPTRVFVAGHLFASWAAYQDGGIAGVIEVARTALTELERELARGLSFVDAVRAADFRLRHTEASCPHSTGSCDT